MRFILFTIITITIYQATLYSQTQNSSKLYNHKVVVEEILQTKNYTYLHVKERINDKDSLLWFALPFFECAVGDIYYYDSGLQMGEFYSKELNRTFNDIFFMGFLSTSPEESDKNIVPQIPVVPSDTLQKSGAPLEIHTVVVKEVKQTRGYTYLRVKEGDKEEWIAVVKINASVGQTYTFDDFALMTDFTSKELNRTFKEIYFISKLKLSTDNKKTSAIQSKGPIKTNEPAIAGLSISKLFENKKLYQGKLVKIEGEVTKYSTDILNKNWIHIKDGTSFSGNTDLVITTNETVKIGDKIIAEGIIFLERDFGSGYFFDLIMEDAKIMIN